MADTVNENKKPKDIKAKSTLASIVFIVFGLLLVIRPFSAVRFVCGVIALAAVIIGIIYLISFLKKKSGDQPYRHDLLIMIVSFVVAAVVYILAYSAFIYVLLPYILGIIILVSGIFKLQTAISVHKINEKGAGVQILIAIINIALGVFFILFPFSISALMLVLVGIAMIFSGVTGLIYSATMRAMVTKFFFGGKKKGNTDTGDAVDVEYRDVPPQQ